MNVKNKKLLTALLITAATACTNSSTLSGKIAVPAPSSAPSSTSLLKLVTGSFFISTVTISGQTVQAPAPSPGPSASGAPQASTPSSGGAARTARIFFDLSKATEPLTSRCSVSSGGAGGAKQCVCQFEWQEVNANTAEAVSIKRSVKTPITNIQISLIECAAPAAYDKEIPNGTLIKISVAPGPSSTEQFSTNTFHFTKNGAVTGDFTDAEGKSFINIHRYSCYEQYKKSMVIGQKINKDALTPPASDTLTQPIDLVLSTQFCALKTGDTADSCTAANKTDYSSQANYYNLYIRSNDIGSINAENESLKCPLVDQPLGNIGTVGSKNYFWPLDSQFALALNPSGDFVVGVEGYSKIAILGDPNGQSSSCFSSGSGGSSGGSSGGDSGGGGDSATGATNPHGAMIKSCLGFAAKPKSNGTCPILKSPTGQAVNTYRLRRYSVMYPANFDTAGKLMSQGYDTVYVVDRPVQSPSNSSIDPDAASSTPYTMKGPKPCPFAYSDALKVNGNATAGVYFSTNDTSWTGKNVDGIAFPNTNEEKKSCSVTFPIFDWLGGAVTKEKWTLVTSSISGINTTNNTYYRDLTTQTFGNLAASCSAGSGAACIDLSKVYIRPVTAWTPNYIEDTTFEACAPLSQPLRDAPMHFVQNATSNNVAWCAAAYPTYNPNITQGTDPTPVRAINTDCNYGVSVTPGGTCRRSVQSVTPDWKYFPLQAHQDDIITGINGNSSYECTMTYDGGGSKTTNKQTPSGGCCGVSITDYSKQGASPYGAYFEPTDTVTCLTPTY